MTTARTPDSLPLLTGALDQARGDWPEFGLGDDIRPSLEAARAAGEDCALVTLFQARGGAPRGVGAQMLVRRGGVSGFLSGGCIEADVTLNALAVLDDGIPRRLVYGEGGPVDIRLPCGGRVEILVERLAADDAAAGDLLKAWHERRPTIWLSDGTVRSCRGDAETNAAFPDIAGLADVGTEGTIYRRSFPQPRLVVFGYDPMVLALCSMAVQSGVETWLIRPKGPPAPPPVPGLRYLHTSPAEDLGRIGVDRWTGVVVAMHDDIDDRDALAVSLPSQAGYVGLLGAKRHLPRKLEQLRRKGLAPESLSRLRAPVGLPIGGRSPWQIAISILAEFTQWSNAEQKRFFRPDAPDASLQTGAPRTAG